MADLRYKVVVDDDEAKRKISELLKGSGVSASGMGDGSGDAKRSTTAVRQLTDEQKKLKAAQLENIESLRQLRKERSQEISDLNILKQIEAEHKATLADKKKETESLIQEEKMLNIEYKKGQLEMQEYNRLLKDQAEARRKANAEEREATQAAKASEKALKDAQREAEKRLKTLERNRAQLEKENSAYYKLNVALGKVRKESKDVLAEMFKLEGEGKKTSAAYQDLANKARGLVAQTQYLDNGIKKIDASLGLHQRNVGNYANALDNLVPIIGQINSQLAAFGTSIDDLAGKPGIFKKIGAGVSGVAKAFLDFVATPIGAFITAFASFFAIFQANKQTVIDFDDGLKSVSKTTGLAGQGLQSYSDDVIQLSRSLKTVESKKLLEYSSVAGQLGVKGRQDLLNFSDALAQLETASDISGEEGATKIARLLTLTDGGVQNVKKFGDEIVNLGNNFAATEGEILANAEAIAQNTGIYKVARTDVLAYATATKAVGLEAELVGSTFSRTLGEFEKVSRTGKGVADLLKVIGGNQAELEKRFKTDASGVFMDYIAGLNRIYNEGGSVNEALERTGIIAVRDQRVIASLASAGFDTLTNAMKTAREANGAMQTEFETGASKLVNQSKRIGIAWDNLILSIENGSGTIGKVSTAVIGFFADVIESVNKSVEATSYWETQVRKVGAVLGYMTASTGWVNKTIDGWFPKAAAVDGEKYFKEFSEKTREEQLKMIANQETMIKNQSVFEQSVSKANLDKMRSLLKKAPVEDLGKTLFDKSDKEVKAEEKAQRKREVLAEKRRQATERQRSLQLEIDKINETASRNQLSRDESEVASVKDKYAKIKEEVRKFYADPKNKGLRVDLGGLQRSENFEVAEATTRQDTKRLTESLTVQKQLLDEYNAYAEATSKDEADKRYAAQLASFKGYKDRLQKEYMDLITLETTSALAGFTGSSVKLTQAQEERAKALRALLDALDKEERERDNKKLISALQSAQSLSDKLVAIEQEYQDKVKALKDAGQLTQEKEFQLRKELTQKYANEIDSSPEFQKAMKNIDEALGSMIGSAYRHGKDVVFGLIDGIKGATNEQKAELRKTFGKFFDDGAKNADLGNLQNIAQASQGFADLANSAVEFASGLADGMDTLQRMVSTAGQLSSAMASLSKNADTQKALQSAGSYFAVFGAVVSIFSGISKSMREAQLAESRRQRDQLDYQNDRQLKSTEAITKMLDRQLELMDKIYGAERLEKYGQTLKQIEDNYADLNRQLNGRYLMTGDKVKDEVLTRLNNGESAKDISKQLYREDIVKWAQALSVLEHLEKFAKSSSITDIGDDLNKAKEELAKLQYQADLGNVDDYTQKLIDQLRNQIDLYTETLNKLKEETTGNSFSSILSNLSDLFFNSGLDSADAWSKGFDSVMKNYAIQKFSREYLEKAAQDWYDLFDQLAEGGITDTERQSLKDAWDKIQKDGQKRVDELGNIIGNDKGSGLSSSIKREVTEQTQSENNGLLRSQTELIKRTFDESKSQGVTMGKHLQVALDSLTALNSIQTNTANTVTELKNAVGELQSINKNLGGRF